MNKANLLAIFIYVFCIIILHNAGHPIFQNLINDADALYLPTLFNNLLKHHGQLSHWYLTPAPYFFPDYLMYGFSCFCTENLLYQILIYSVLQVISLNSALYYFFTLFHKGRAFNLSILSTLTLIILAINIGQPYSLILYSAFHYGSFLFQIITLALFILWLKKHRSNYLIALICLTFITTLSDSLYVIQWTLPAYLTYFIWIKINKRTSQWKDYLPLCSSALGHLIYPHIITHPMRYSIRPGIQIISQHLHQIKVIFIEFITHAPILSILLIMTYISTIIIITRKWRVISTNEHFFYLFIIISMITTLVPPLIMKNFDTVLRYFIPIVTWPVITNILLLSKTKIFHRSHVLLSIILLSYFIWNTLSWYQKNKLQIYPHDLACIDKALSHYPDLHNGIAQYWDAKIYQLLSHHPITLAQYGGDFSEFRWITSSDYYKSTYDFVIQATQIQTPFHFSSKMLLHYGKPLEIVHCGTHNLWIYGKNKLKIIP